MVRDWLDTIFEDRMQAIKGRRGDTCGPSSTDLNPLYLFMSGLFMEQVKIPFTSNIKELKARIKRKMKELGQEGSFHQ